MRPSLTNLLEKYIRKSRDEVVAEIGEYFENIINEINKIGVVGEGQNAAIAHLLAMFRGRYERLTNVNELVLRIIEVCCSTIVESLGEKECDNFLDISGKIRSLAWKEGTRAMLYQVLPDLNQNDIEEISIVLRDVYRLASEWLHGRGESKDLVMQNLGVIIDNFYFLLYLECKIKYCKIGEGKGREAQEPVFDCDALT